VLRHDINTKFGEFFINNPPPYGVRGPAYAVTIPAGFHQTASTQQGRVKLENEADEF